METKNHLVGRILKLTMGRNSWAKFLEETISLSHWKNSTSFVKLFIASPPLGLSMLSSVIYLLSSWTIKIPKRHKKKVGLDQGGKQPSCDQFNDGAPDTYLLVSG